MPIREQVILEFVVDDDQLNGSIENLAALTGADQKLVEKLKQSTSAYQERTRATQEATKAETEFKTSADGTIRTAEQLSNAIKRSLGNITKGGLKELSFDIRRAIVEELQRAGVSVRQFKTLWNQQFGETRKTTQSLTQQLRLAKQELATLAATPGVDPLQLKQAAQRAAELDDRIGDINNTIKAFNPDTKLQSLNTLGIGLNSTFTLAAGSLQAFGVQNEIVNGLVQKFAGLLNFSQGVAQLAQLKDAWSNVKLSLGETESSAEGVIDAFKDTGEIAADTKALADTTTLAKSAVDKLKVAKIADAAASETAATANIALGLSMPVVAVSALGVGIIALIGYLMTLEQETDQTKESFERLFNLRKEGKELQDQVQDLTLQLQVARGEITELDAKVLQSIRNQSRELRPLLDQRNQLIQKINEEKAAAENSEALARAASRSSREGAAIQAAQATKRLQIQQANIAALEEERKQLELNIKAVSKKFETERDIARRLDKNAADKKKQDEKELEREQQFTEALKLRTGNEERALQLALTALGLTEQQSQALRVLGFEGIKSSEVYLTLSDTQVEALAALDQFAKGSFDALRNFFNKAKEEVKKGAEVVGTTTTKTTSDITGKTSEELEALKRLIQDIIDGLDQISDNVFQIEQINLAQALDKEIAFYNGKREAELKNKRLTEEQKQKIQDKYDKQVAKAKEDAAKKQRQADLIQMGVNQSLAIAKLATENPPPSPQFFIGLGIILTTIAAQIASIRSAPLPEYRYGVEKLEGPGTGTSDSIVARVSKGERITPADVNQDYFPALSAIHNRKIPPAIANEMLTNYTRNFEVTKIITQAGGQQSTDPLSQKLAMLYQFGGRGDSGPSQYDIQSTEYLRIIAEAVNRSAGSDNLRRSRS